MAEIIEEFKKRKPSGSFNYYIRFKCECGKEGVRSKSYYKGIEQKCKRCSGNYRGNIEGKHNGVGDLTRTRYKHMKQKAKERGYTFDVSIEYLWELFLAQDKRCVLSGLEITITSDTYVSNGQNRIDWTTNTASLDRIDSKLGYIEGNVQFVHKDINRMKQHFPEDYFIRLCSLVYAHSLPSTPKEDEL
jgi:hypothetical protein